MDNSLCATWAPRITSLIRIGAGYMLFIHGTAKLFGTPHVAAFEHLQVMSIFGIAGIIELVFGALVLLGLFARPAAFVASGLGAAAYLVGHVAPKGHFLLPILTGGETAILYAFVFFLLFLYGPGPWSLDALMGRTRS
jgi:putative oxidoreductase